MIVIVGRAPRRILVLILGGTVDVDHLTPAEDFLEAIEDQRVIPFTLLVLPAFGGERRALLYVVAGGRPQLPRRCPAVAIRSRPLRQCPRRAASAADGSPRAHATEPARIVLLDGLKNKTEVFIWGLGPPSR